MSEYLTFPAVDGSYNFPPQVREAFAGSAELAEAVVEKIADEPTVAAAAADAADEAVAAIINGAMYYRGLIADGTDLNDYDSVSENGIYSLSGSYTYPNDPFPTKTKSLILHANALGVTRQTVIEYGTGNTKERNILNFYATPKTWTAWRYPNDIRVTEYSFGTLDLDSLRTTQDVFIANGTMTVTGWPTGVPRVAAHVQIRALSGGITFQIMHTYGPDGTILSRQTSTVGTTPYPFADWEDLNAPPANVVATVDQAMNNTLLKEDWSRRRGGRKKVTTGVVAFRFDDGLNAFDTKIRPLMEARGLKYSLAVCSNRWTEAENNSVTPTMVNNWVTGGLAEVWNHTRNHTGAITESVWKSEIGQGLDELRTQIPAAQIDGFIVPGTGGTGWGNPAFVAGTTVEEFFNTAAGRYILERHAVSTGYIPGTSRRLLDGMIRQGQYHFTLDTETSATAIAQINLAKTEKSGLQFMLHGSQLDLPGNLTTAGLVSILDYVITERDAGRLKVLSPYEMMLADAT